MTERWERGLACVLNDLGECLAKIPEACQCRRMPKTVYEDAHKRLVPQQPVLNQ